MLTILIVDDEKLERRGIRFLLEREHGNEEFHILEAANGRAACDLLKRQDVDLLFTDIKMPFMDGLELAAHARELRPQIETVIFSGYGEFEYARQAMRSGVEYYVLKPVDPREFAATLKAVLEKIRDRKQQEQKQQASQDFLNEYFLGKYFYQGTPDLLRRISGRIDITGWERIQGLILIEGEDCFFEDSEETFIRELSGEIQQKLMFLNLGQNQELCVLCSSCDLPVLAEHICRWINARFGSRFYVAAGRQVERPQELPAAFRELEVLMENKFYQKEKRLFLPGKTLKNAEAEQFLDDILGRMAENIRLNDITHLWEHFRILQTGAGELSRYSQIYTKFMFSNLVREFYMHQQARGRRLEDVIRQVYELQSIQEVLGLVESLITEMEQQLSVDGHGSRNEVAKAKSYIYEHYSEEIGVETLAELVYLSPGYFSYIFKKETGENVSRFIRCYRMEKAKELLAGTSKKIVQICKETGFSNVSYFCKSFREYCGCSPEQYRKGETAGEVSETKIQ